MNLTAQSILRAVFAPIVDWCVLSRRLRRDTAIIGWNLALLLNRKSVKYFSNRRNFVIKLRLTLCGLVDFTTQLREKNHAGSA